MKMSYIITTIRPFKFAHRMINSIFNLAPHDYEIIISSPNDYSEECGQLKNTKFLLDNKQIGSVYANNMSIKESNGDWLFFLPDDFQLVSTTTTTNNPSHVNPGKVKFDIHRFIDYVNSDDMQRKTFQMITLADRMGNQIDKENYVSPISEKYCVMHFPCVSRETIFNKLNGVIFNHRFKHAYVDHWLGYYASQFDEYEPYNYSLFEGSYNSLIELSFNHNIRNHTNDNHDYSSLKYIYEMFKENKNIGYNF